MNDKTKKEIKRSLRREKAFAFYSEESISLGNVEEVYADLKKVQEIQQINWL